MVPLCLAAAPRLIGSTCCPNQQWEVTFLLHCDGVGEGDDGYGGGRGG